jgi:hypothetical protein
VRAFFLRARDIDGVVAQARAGARCWLGTMAVLCVSTREDKNKMKKYRLAKCSHAHSLLLKNVLLQLPIPSSLH